MELTTPQFILLSAALMIAAMIIGPTVVRLAS